MRYFIYCRKSSESEDRQILSIESQLSSLTRAFRDRADIEIVGIYEEAFSAKAPGRPHFQAMMTRISKGEAVGIVAWAPDRLARNSIDGGQIVYFLDRGIIKDLKFATYTFENNSQGKFMLQIMFGQSKYYSDALSENVKRGNRTKLEKGWRPSQTPLGYLNDPATKTIIKDPLRFPLVRRMFELMLTGAYSPKAIAILARDEWGLRTPQKRRIGGTPIALSTVYRILNNPFYAGQILWNNQTYIGKHDPVLTIDEFERVRSLLERPGRPKPQKHIFAYTGMIRCASCGLAITAEHKTNRYGSRYTYYHCTKRTLASKCPEPSVELRALETQIQDFLRNLTINPDLERWILEELALSRAQVQDQEAAKKHSLEEAFGSVSAQLNELTGLRLRNLLTDALFVEQRQGLELERQRLREKIANAGRRTDMIEPFKTFVSMSNRATDWFLRANDQEKRLILETVGSNLTLKGKILSIEATKPFCSIAKNTTCLRMRRFKRDVRTPTIMPHRQMKDMIGEFADVVHDQARKETFNNIRRLIERFEPEKKQNRPPPEAYP